MVSGAAPLGPIGRFIVRHVPDFPLLFDPLFMDYRDGRQWYLVVELVVSALIAAAAALSDAVGCVPASSVLLIVSILLMVGLAALRPFSVPVDNAFAVLMALVQVGAAVCQMLDALDVGGSNDVGDGLITFMSAMAMLKSVYELLKLVRRASSDKSADKAAKRQRRLAAAASSSSGAVPHARGTHFSYDAQAQPLLEMQELVNQDDDALRNGAGGGETTQGGQAAELFPLQATNTIAPDDLDDGEISEAATEVAAMHSSDRFDPSYLDEMTDGIKGSDGAAAPSGALRTASSGLTDEQLALHRHREAMAHREQQRQQMADREFEAERNRRHKAISSGLLAERRVAQGADLTSGYDQPGGELDDVDEDDLLLGGAGLVREGGMSYFDDSDLFGDIGRGGLTNDELDLI